MCDMWRYLVNDVTQVAKEILETFKGFPPHSPMMGSLKPAANNSGVGGTSSSHSFPMSNSGQFLSQQQQQQLLPNYRDPLLMEDTVGYHNSLNNSLRGAGGGLHHSGHHHLHRQHYQPPHHATASHYPTTTMGDRGHPDGMSHRGSEGGPPWGGGGGYNGSSDFSPYFPRGYGGGGPSGGYVAGSGSRSGMAAALDILDMYKDVGGEENAILKHARTMLGMAQAMHKFTLGGSSHPAAVDAVEVAGGSTTPLRRIKTTQDFFTQAEFFAEESNRLYKLIRMFSYLVPTGEDKRVLMQIADHIPRHCGQMQLLIQLPGVGKESTFRKVDAIIKENNQIMYLIAKVVQICFANAKKYDLDFRGITLAGPAGGPGDDAAATFGSSGGAGGGGSSSLDTGIGFGSSRRGGPPAAAAGNKRTRVSFLLY
jgi:hypothetical protein